MYFAAHGKTEFAKGRGEEAGKLRSAARLPLGPVVYTKWPFDATEAARRQKETADGLGLPVEIAVDLPPSPGGSGAASGGGVKLELVLIPAGEFLMGPKYTPEELAKRGNWGDALNHYKREIPRHKVRLTRPYYLGKCEVTQEQWEKAMGANPAAFKGPKNPVEQGQLGRLPGVREEA